MMLYLDNTDPKYLLFTVVSVNMLLLLSGCLASRHHAPDAELHNRFVECESDFTYLLNQAATEQPPRFFSTTSIGYEDREYLMGQDSQELALLGFPSEKISNIKSVMNKIGIVKVVNGSSKVEFRVDQGTMGNGDSFKGYAYFKEDRPKSLVESLDNYSCSSQAKDQFGNCLAFRLLKGNWYLFLFING